jgi:hypothetical protein
MIMRYWKRLSNGLSGWWKKRVSSGNTKSGNITKNPPPFLIGKKRPFNEN